MMKTERITGTQFLDTVKPRETDGKKIYPNKKTVFNALFAARGTHVSENDIPRMPKLDAVAHLNGRNAEMRIRSFEMSPDSFRGLEPKDSHYVEVALSAYLHAGGEMKNFASELKDARDDFEMKNDNFNVLRMQQERGAVMSA